MDMVRDAIFAFSADTIVKIDAIIRFPGPDGTVKSEAGTDALVFKLVESHLARLRGSEWLVSPEALGLMLEQGYLARVAQNSKPRPVPPPSMH